MAAKSCDKLASEIEQFQSASSSSPQKTNGAKQEQPGTPNKQGQAPLSVHSQARVSQDGAEPGAAGASVAGREEGGGTGGTVEVGRDASSGAVSTQEPGRVQRMYNGLSGYASTFWQEVRC